MRKSHTAAPGALGPLEMLVMETLWERGKSTVRDVVTRLNRSLAYTTVMTTLDRLYKKGMLERRVTARAYSYWPRWSRQEWDQKRAGDMVTGFLAGPQPSSGSLLISCLVEALGQYDLALLDEMERKIRMKRVEKERNSGS
jgi:predicted transcriptional regulator